MSDPTRNVATHPLIAHVAGEMAGAMYEQMASKDADFYRLFPNVDEYVKQSWPLFVESARSTLAQLLQRGVDDALKEDIYEAILADNTVRHGRGIQVRM